MNIETTIKIDRANLTASASQLGLGIGRVDIFCNNDGATVETIEGESFAADSWVDAIHDWVDHLESSGVSIAGGARRFEFVSQ